MKNRALVVLFGLSLVVNGVLAWKVLDRAPALPDLAGPSPATSPARPESAASPTAMSVSRTPDARATGAEAAVPSRLLERLRTVRSDDEIRSLVGDLRAAGVPRNVIRGFVAELLAARFAGREPTQPFWRRHSPSPEFVAATQTLATERQALLEKLLGDDASPAATLTAAQREQRYGSLSDEKLNAVARIEREYDEMRAKAGAARETNASSRINGEIDQQRLLEQEKLRDLAAILSPEELEQYELRNTQTAQGLMRSLGGIDLAADEFAALYRLQRAVDLDHPFKISATPDMDALAARMKAQDDANEQARAVLSDDRYYKYLESVDFGYAGIARFAAAYPQISRETTLKVHRLQNELQNAWQVATRVSKPGGKMTPPDVKAFDARLVELLGPEIAAAYKKQGNGRVFVVPTGG